MATQIAFTLAETKKKKQFQKMLQSEGLTSKAFFNFCIDAYLSKQIKFGLLPSSPYWNPDPDRIEESEKNKQAYEKSVAWTEESFSLSEVKKLLSWNTK